jgi:hypothetical protein
MVQKLFKGGNFSMIETICGNTVVVSCKKVQKSDFQSQFLTSKINGLVEEYQFKSIFFVKGVFLTASIFEMLYFLKLCPVFDNSPLYRFKKNIIISFGDIDFWPKIYLRNFVSLS